MSAHCSILIVIALLVSATNSLTCLTNDCNGWDFCGVVCPSEWMSCARIVGLRGGVFPPGLLTYRFMGCTPLQCNFTSFTCRGNPNTIEQICCCSTDYCNDDSLQSQSVIPKFSYGIDQPPPPIPTTSEGELVCTNYSCSNTTGCHYTYEVCNETLDKDFKHVCISSYEWNNQLNKLSLVNKGCGVVSTGMCDTKTCIVDAPISRADRIYTCCCNEQLCNANETFTHPTLLDSYGYKECRDRKCPYNCIIKDNDHPICTCPSDLNTTTCDEDVNECLHDNGGCEHICIDTLESYHCACHYGYTLDTKTNSKCLNCAIDNGGCQQVCVNDSNSGNYHCECTSGYVLDLTTNSTCLDYDECTINNGGCDQICSNKVGSFLCSCHDGYTLHNNNACLDNNECLVDNGECESICVNTNGSYYCTCHDGYTLDARTSTKCFNKSVEFYCSSYHQSSNILGKIELCTENEHSCLSMYYALHDGTLVHSLSSCFNPADYHSIFGLHCSHFNCSLTAPIGQFNTFVCCCNQPDCNGPQKDDSDGSTVLSATSDLMYTGSPQVVVAPAVDWHNPWFIAVFTIFLLSLIFLLLSMIIALLFVSRKLLTIKKRDREKDNYIVQFHSHLYTDGNFSLHNIEVNGIYLVVALYESGTDHYRTQKNIYLTKGIQHDNILALTTEATHLPKYWLTFKGTISQTLLSHLKSSNIDREMLCLFCHSIASGISHLHRGINGGNVIICHRNINSCSILVRNDLKSCVISDFGCCVKYFKGDLVLKGSCQSGKLRHVAPEVLDNSLDVYNAISVIRSDVYSFGVVMWELFNHLISSRYQSPFEEYLPVDDSEFTRDDMALIFERNLRLNLPEMSESHYIMDSLARLVNLSLDVCASSRPSIIDIMRANDAINTSEVPQFGEVCDEEWINEPEYELEIQPSAIVIPAEVHYTVTEL